MSIDCIAFAKALDLRDAECAQARLLLYVIAENTFNDSFVCRLSQEQLAYEAGRTTDRTVRRYLDQLEAAGLILRSRNAGTGDGRAPDAIRIVGYKRWYHGSHGSAAGRGAVKHRRSAKRGATGQSVRVGQPDNLSGWATGQHAPGATGQQVSGTEEDSRTYRTKTLPPTPQGGRVGVEGADAKGQDGAATGARGGRLPGRQSPRAMQEQIDGLIASVRRHDDTAERSAAIATLIDPLCRLRTFDAPDPGFALGVLADAAARHPQPVLAEALAAVLAERAAKVAPAHVERALAAAAKAHDAREARERPTANGSYWADSRTGRAMLDAIRARDPYEADQILARSLPLITVADQKRFSLAPSDSPPASRPEGAELPGMRGAPDGASKEGQAA